jgi:GT2 family glycosyltransferase/glycosyltransferase involved in cell wall biosynthesis
VLELPRIEARPLGSPARGLVFQERRLPPAVRDDRIDVFFAPAYTCPLALDRPRVTAVHDLSFFSLPEDFRVRDGVRRRLLVAASLRASTRILACSGFTRREIARHFPECAEKVLHVPLAADDDLLALPPRDEARRRLDVRGPLVVTVGAILNRRCLPVLLRAMRSLARRSPVVLDVVGENRTHPPIDFPARVRALGLEDRVRLSGFVSEAALADRYAAADAAVFLSEYEGFGLPALEAAARGVPLVVSDRPSLGEIFGKAALLVDPHDAPALTDAIADVLGVPELRARLIAAGHDLAARHSWTETARRTREALAAAAGSPLESARGSSEPDTKSGNLPVTSRQANPPLPVDRGEGLTAPRVSAVVVSHNTRDDLLRCLAALATRVRLPLEVIVVDNASADGSAAAVRRDHPEVRVLESPENLGFARANNLGLREARAPHVLILNSDAEVARGAVETMAALLEARSDVGIVAPRTLNEDGSVQVSFGEALTPLAEWRQQRLVRGVRARRRGALLEAARRASMEHEPAWVSASCLLARREVLDAVGGFDEAFFLYEEDVDLCVRVRRAGYKVVFTPAAEVVHRLGTSMARSPERAAFEYHRSHLIYYRKHQGPLATALLRSYLAGRAAWAWLRAVGPGAGRASRRGAWARVLQLALSGG